MHIGGVRRADRSRARAGTVRQLNEPPVSSARRCRFSLWLSTCTHSSSYRMSAWHARRCGLRFVWPRRDSSHRKQTNTSLPALRTTPSYASHSDIGARFVLRRHSIEGSLCWRGGAPGAGGTDTVVTPAMSLDTGPDSDANEADEGSRAIAALSAMRKHVKKET